MSAPTLDPRAVLVRAVKRKALDEDDERYLIDVLGLDDPTIDFAPTKESAPLATNDPKTGAREPSSPTKPARNVKGMTTPPGLANLKPVEEPAEEPAPAPKRRPGPGPKPPPPCGSYAAFARHRRDGMKVADIDDACKAAEREYHTDARRRRAEAKKKEKAK